MVERLFLAVPLGCLWFVIVVFSDHTHLLFLVSTVFLHVYTLTKVYAQKAHVIAAHVHWEWRSYLLPMLQTASIVYIDDSY